MRQRAQNFNLGRPINKILDPPLSLTCTQFLRPIQKLLSFLLSGSMKVLGVGPRPKLGHFPKKLVCWSKVFFILVFYNTLFFKGNCYSRPILPILTFKRTLDLRTRSRENRSPMVPTTCLFGVEGFRLYLGK